MGVHDVREGVWQVKNRRGAGLLNTYAGDGRWVLSRRDRGDLLRMRLPPFTITVCPRRYAGVDSVFWSITPYWNATPTGPICGDPRGDPNDLVMRCVLEAETSMRAHLARLSVLMETK